MDLACSPIGNQISFAQINVDHLIEKEREKLIHRANRSKHITMLKFAEEKERKLLLQRALDKKQKEARKNVMNHKKTIISKREKFLEKEDKTFKRIEVDVKAQTQNRYEIIKDYAQTQK